MGDTSDDDKSEKSDETSSLEKNFCSYEKQKKHEIQHLQSLKKISLVDILLKKIQPSLSEREWIINQRQRNVSPITSIKSKLVCTNSFNFLI